jgi:ATP-dependent Clp protease, protease subunit
MMELPNELESALLGRRVVFLRGRLDDSTANRVIAQFLLVSRTAPGQLVELYLDSPGGSLSAALSIYDIIQTLGAPLATTCMGTAGGASVLVLAAGTAGRRYALPHARIHLSEEEMAVSTAKPDELDEVARLRTRWLTALAQHVGHSAARLSRDLSAHKWLSAAEARDYGLVDGIIPGSPGGAQLRPG